jgi:hypothetical protein
MELTQTPHSAVNRGALNLLEAAIFFCSCTPGLSSSHYPRRRFI